jgi:hypothetical protein
MYTLGKGVFFQQLLFYMDAHRQSMTDPQRQRLHLFSPATTPLSPFISTSIPGTRAQFDECTRAGDRHVRVREHDLGRRPHAQDAAPRRESDLRGLDLDPS